MLVSKKSISDSVKEIKRTIGRQAGRNLQNVGTTNVSPAKDCYQGQTYDR